MLKAKYEEIVHVEDIAIGEFRHPSEAISMGLKEKVDPASDDVKRVLLIGIDWQNDFVLSEQYKVGPGMPYGSLSVPGARGDIRRWTRFIYDNLQKVTRIMLSVDTHQPNQIFHRAAWLDRDGNLVEPYTLIKPQDIWGSGNSQYKYVFVGGRNQWAIDCAKTLEENGKGGIFIWPDHCIEGTFGWNLETELMQMVTFHSAARQTKPYYIYKGRKPYSEMYGIVEPEYNPSKKVNWDVIRIIAHYSDDSHNKWTPRGGEIDGLKWDKVIFAGEAASHCLLESVKQILKYFEKGHAPAEAYQGLYILEDCTSPVAGFERQMEGAFKEFAERGVNIVKSTELTL